MKTRIAVIIGIIIAGIACYGAGQSQGYHPQQRILPEPIVMQIEISESNRVSTVQIDMSNERAALERADGK